MTKTERSLWCGVRYRFSSDNAAFIWRKVPRQAWVATAQTKLANTRWQLWLGGRTTEKQPCRDKTRWARRRYGRSGIRYRYKKLLVLSCRYHQYHTFSWYLFRKQENICYLRFKSRFRKATLEIWRCDRWKIAVVISTQGIVLDGCTLGCPGHVWGERAEARSSAIKGFQFSRTRVAWYAVLHSIAEHSMILSHGLEETILSVCECVVWGNVHSPGILLSVMWASTANSTPSTFWTVAFSVIKSESIQLIREELNSSKVAPLPQER